MRRRISGRSSGVLNAVALVVIVVEGVSVVVNGQVILVRCNCRGKRVLRKGLWKE